MDSENWNLLRQGAELLKVLGHPVRLCIVRNLARKGEASVSEMQDCLTMPQSTVSQHLAKLRAYGVIKPSRRGKEVYYSISDPRVTQVVEAVLGAGKHPDG
ncbi:MAG: ArsR/SmtB family transcription factor [Bacillota bacterium]